MPSSYDKGTTFLFMVNSDLPLMGIMCFSSGNIKMKDIFFPPWECGLWMMERTSEHGFIIHML